MNAKCIAFALASSQPGGARDAGHVASSQFAISSPAQSILRRLTGQVRAKNVLDWKSVGRVAQVVEQRPFKAWVAGSNPAALTNDLTTHDNPAGRNPFVERSCGQNGPVPRLCMETHNQVTRPGQLEPAHVVEPGSLHPLCVLRFVVAGAGVGPYQHVE